MTKTWCDVCGIETLLGNRMKKVFFGILYETCNKCYGELWRYNNEITTECVKKIEAKFPKQEGA